MAKSDYIKDDGVKEMAVGLMQRFADQLKHIDLDRILFVRELNRTQKNSPGSCKPVKPPYNLLNPDILYIISIYFKANWDELPQAQWTFLVLHQLLHISEEFDGSVVPHDSSDWAFIINQFGTDYMERADLPNLLTGEISAEE